MAPGSSWKTSSGDMLPDPAVLTYYGRDEAASPATGSMNAHNEEEREFIAQALDLPSKPAPGGCASCRPTTGHRRQHDARFRLKEVPSAQFRLPNERTCSPSFGHRPIGNRHT